MTQEQIIEQIRAERRRQNSKHPMPAGFPPEHRLAILIEEVGEVGKAINERDPVETRTELVQVAATALRWIEEMDNDAIDNMNNIQRAGISPEPEEIEAHKAATGRIVPD